MAATRRLVVRTGPFRVSIDVAQIREVAAMPDLTPLPGAPSAALGLALLRGELTPVVDLARLIDQDGPGGTPTKIVSLTSPLAALAVEGVEKLEAAADGLTCTLEIDGAQRPYPLAEQLVRAFDEAWRDARTATR